MERTSSQYRFSRDLVRDLRQQNLKVKKVDNLFQIDCQDGAIKINATLCPIYNQGGLNESSLMEDPVDVRASRVAAKWQTLTQTLQAIRLAGEVLGRSVEPMITYADRGVIVQNVDLARDNRLLKLGSEAYRRALDSIFGQRYSFRSYSELSEAVPRFISGDRSEDAGLDVLVSRMANSNLDFAEDVLTGQPGIFSPKARDLLRRLLQQYGSGLTSGLLQQYGHFDSLTSAPEAVNIFIERESAGLLLQVTDLFRYKNYPRLDLLC